MIGDQATGGYTRAGGVPLYVLGALAVVMAALAIGAVTAREASATTFSVSNTNNSGPGSLRAAVAAAEANPGPDNINIGSSVRGDIEVYNIGGQEGFSIYTEVTINGPGAGFVAVDGNDQTRVFGIAPGAKVTIRGITIKRGKTYPSDPDAGGIANGGNLTLERAVVSENTAYGQGGGISNTGALMIAGSSFSGNTSFIGGGVYNYRGGTVMIAGSTFSGNNSTNGAGGAVSSTQTGSTLTVTNSTFSGNEAPEGGGGGIYIGGGSNSTITNTTVASNNAKLGGGIYNSDSASLRNSIVAGNTASAEGPDVYQAFHSQGNNLIGDVSDTSGFLASDLLNRNPLLGPLQHNGGPTPTRALLPGSPAIDAGTNTGCPVTDQRGVARRDGDGNGSVVCDIGAYERTDLASPRVASTSPAAGATNVRRGANLSATFSERMTRSTLDTATFKLFRVNVDGSATQVAGGTTVVASADGLKASLNPFGAAQTLLGANTTYRAIVTAGASDLAGNGVDQNPSLAGRQQMVWTFRTGSI